MNWFDKVLTKEKRLQVGQSPLKYLADYGLHERVTSHVNVLILNQDLIVILPMLPLIRNLKWYREMITMISSFQHILKFFHTIYFSHILSPTRIYPPCPYLPNLRFFL